MTLDRPVQSGIFLAGLLVLAALDMVFAPGPLTQALLLAPAVALLGLPHGALDLPMARVLWPLTGAADHMLFYGAYIGIAGAVAALWWLAPGLALIAFLAYSALHFSGDWETDGLLLRIAGGLSVIGAPALFHVTDVVSIFSVLSHGAWAEPIAYAIAVAGLIGASLGLIALLQMSQHAREALLELVGIWIGAAILPPLLYFIAYFCLLHSLRHMRDTLQALPERKAALRAAAGIMVVSLLGASIALGLFLHVDGVDLESSVLRVVFIGLAALTVPHMLLVERFRYRRPSA